MASHPPPPLSYSLSLLQNRPNIIRDNLLSRDQLEIIARASQAHCTMLPDNVHQRGFFLGDGPGVGKGRQIAGLFLENWIQGRKKGIWLSISQDLQHDARRDLDDVDGTDIPTIVLSGDYGDLQVHEGESLSPFPSTNNQPSLTHTTLSFVPILNFSNVFSLGVMFVTYSMLVAKSGNRTRFNQILAWLGPHFDGLIAFDECHMGNKKTETRNNVMALQNLFPKARVVYSSATGASVPAEMRHMERLGSYFSIVYLSLYMCYLSFFLWFFVQSQSPSLQTTTKFISCRIMGTR